MRIRKEVLVQIRECQVWFLRGDNLGLINRTLSGFLRGHW